MKKLRPKLTYSNVVSTLCLFLLVGGGTTLAATQLAKNSVGSKQLKNGAVTGAKVKDGSLGAADISGPVGSALSATNAASASSATDSANLGGSPPSAYKDKCPSETTPVGKSLCVTGPVIKGEVKWVAAAQGCAKLGLRLPTPGEALIIGPSVSVEDFWTDDFWTTASASMALYYDVAEDALYAIQSAGNVEVICVTTPSNS